MSRLFLCLALIATAQAQTPEEIDHLRKVMGEAGSSPVEQLRAIEAHIAKYPDSPRLADLEKVAAKAAVEAGDRRRTQIYGEKQLARDAGDPQLLEKVIEALLEGGKEEAERALAFATKLDLILENVDEDAPTARQRARLSDEIEQARSRADLLEARVLAKLGRPLEAVPVLAQAFATYPSAEVARERAQTLERVGNWDEAARAWAEALTIPDTRTTDMDRTRYRERLETCWIKARGSKTGMGEIVLSAIDGHTHGARARREALQKIDPNLGRREAMQYTLEGIDGQPLALQSLTSKVVVLDFWATWCGPCRAQYPLYRQVEEKYKGNPDVVFLAVNTDEDRSGVKAFLAAQEWQKAVYYDDGLSQLLRVTSIPTTMIFDGKGKLASRMNGFIPERFVEMLVERIDSALKH